MLATFILTRTFTISALFVGAILPVALAAPVISSDMVHSIPFDKRFCRQMSCLFEVPTDTTDASKSTETADAEPTKIGSDSTEAVFVAGSGDTLMAGTPVEAGVEDVGEHAESV